MLKNDFFGFPKSKWLHVTGEVDKSVRVSCQIFSRFNGPQIIKIGEFWTELFKKIKRWTFLGTRGITTTTRYNGLFSSTSWYQKGKTSLDLNEARDFGVVRCTGISWTICRQSAPCCRQITTPSPYHSVLQAGCSSSRPTNSVSMH